MSHAAKLVTQGRPTETRRDARLLRLAGLGILLSALPLTGALAQLDAKVGVSTQTNVDAAVSSPSLSTTVDSTTSATVGTSDSTTGAVSTGSVSTATDAVTSTTSGTATTTTNTTGSVTGTVTGTVGGSASTTTGTLTGTVGGASGTVTGTVGGTAGSISTTVGGTAGSISTTVGGAVGSVTTTVGTNADVSAEAKAGARALYLQALGISEGDIGLQLTPGEGAIELDDAATFQLIASGWGQVRVNADDGFADHAERIKAFVRIATSLGYEASVGVLQAYFGTIGELSTELSAEARARVQAIRAALRGDVSAEARAELLAELSALLTAGRQVPQGASAWWVVDLDVTGDGRVTVADLQQVAANQ